MARRARYRRKRLDLRGKSTKFQRSRPTEPPQLQVTRYGSSSQRPFLPGIIHAIGAAIIGFAHRTVLQHSSAGELGARTSRRGTSRPPEVIDAVRAHGGVRRVLRKPKPQDEFCAYSCSARCSEKVHGCREGVRLDVPGCSDLARVLGWVPAPPGCPNQCAAAARSCACKFPSIAPSIVAP